MRDESLRIDASPTKDFFIYMLTKDIDLIRAIADLVDNSVDGARRIKGNTEYEGLVIRLEVLATHFKIHDNCGGIPIEIARKYAFRFGRVKGMPETPYSIGQFGVGMKRALFKLGNIFNIESVTSTSKFSVEGNVQEWAKDKDNWDFIFSELNESFQAMNDQVYTSIIVTELHTSVSEEFSLENFQKRLSLELEAAHQYSLNEGLIITLNGIPLTFRPAQLLSSDELKPAFVEKEIIISGKVKISIKIYVGLAKSDPQNAGWHVFCNGRLILEADRSRTTGWGDGSIPQFHNQFARFRGYTFFDSDDASLLPWTTTKSSVDTGSPVFREVRLDMLTLMRPVIDFLNQMERERKGRDDNTDPTPLELIINEAKSVNLSDVGQTRAFIAPKLKTESTPKIRMNKIQYSKPTEEIDRVKSVLKVSSLKEVGEETFDYFLRMECED